MKKMVEFDDYDSVSQHLISLPKGWSFSMNVGLGEPTMDTKVKEPFVKEFIYHSNKYSDRNKLITVKKRCFPYLALNYADENGYKRVIKITIYDIIPFQELIENINELLPKAFKKNSRDDYVKISKNIFNVGLEISGHSITFYPDKIADTIGVMMCVDNTVYTSISLRSLRGLLYTTRTIDLFGWSFGIVSGYHELGENQFDFTSKTKNYDPTSNQPEIDLDALSVTKNNKTKPVTEQEKRKSFFD